jgi:hypothetical protein
MPVHTARLQKSLDLGISLVELFSRLKTACEGYFAAVLVTHELAQIATLWVKVQSISGWLMKVNVD